MACLLAFCLAGLIPSDASADDDATSAAPRTVIQIGDASIVLVAANDRLHAFIDRIEDNAPITDAELKVTTGNGAVLDMSQATDGLFVGPFSHAGRVRDSFAVSLRSSVSTGEASADIVYEDAASAPHSGASTPIGVKLAIALVSAGIGAIGATLIMLRFRGSRRRGAAHAVRPAGAT